MKSFIARMDTNRNGKIDPDEAQGRASFMLSRMGISVTKSISVDDLARQVSSRFGGRSRGGSSRRSGGEGSSRRSGRSSSSSEPPEQEFDLVPGFGIEDDSEFLEPVLAFGVRDELYDIKTTAADREEAAKIMRTYDRNKDRVLDKKEMGSVRWRSDPWQHDRNRDGRLTIDELAMRYALRRQGRENIGRTSKSLKQANKRYRSRRSSSSSSSSSSRSRSRSPWGRSGGRSSSSGDRTSRFVDLYMQRYDRNKNGYLEKSERAGMRMDVSAADKNRDGKVSKKELAAFMSQRFGGARSGSRFGGGMRFSGGFSRSRGFGGRSGGRSGGGSRWFTRSNRSSSSRSGSNQSKSSSGKLNDAKTYKRMTVLERMEKDGLQKDLPEWFTQSDRNEDGQIKMSEFATSWNDKTIRDFGQFDGNKDGIITAQECIAAKAAGAVRGVAPAATADSGSSRSSRSSPSASSSRRSSWFGGSRSSRSSRSTRSVSRKPRRKKSKEERYIAYAVGQIKKYDLNKDGVLSKDEIAKMKYPPKAGTDADKDGKITPKELAKALMGK